MNLTDGSSYTGSAISMTFSVTNSSLSNVADDGVYAGSLTLNSSSNATIEYTLDKSNFTNIS